jgi:hypothetical protein
MPWEDILEMVADWCSAGYVTHGKLDVVDWYEANKHKIILEESSRETVEELLYYIRLGVWLNKESADIRVSEFLALLVDNEQTKKG